MKTAPLHDLVTQACRLSGRQYSPAGQLAFLQHTLPPLGGTLLKYFGTDPMSEDFLLLLARYRIAGNESDVAAIFDATSIALRRLRNKLGSLLGLDPPTPRTGRSSTA